MAIVEDIEREITARHRFLLTTHIHPDGDAIGSLLAMGFLLEHLGKEAVLFTEDPIPPQYHFLPGVAKITHELPDLSTIDACFVLDCGDSKRIGRVAPRLLE
ncbi:MAG: bifunctional oligoribonuclease/PAP phosphatase NrnA, partial [Deltaproteobacteria bacterium]|nr:bifunctional oligoribonuclease/PAP phosphatase NrnA [Deltaproteobacteria bacterium]